MNSQFIKFSAAFHYFISCSCHILQETCERGFHGYTVVEKNGKKNGKMKDATWVCSKKKKKCQHALLYYSCGFFMHILIIAIYKLCLTVYIFQNIYVDLYKCK